MGHRSRRRSVAVIAGLMAVSVAALGLGGAAGAGQAASGEPIKFGYIEGLPGASAQPVILQALQAYVDDWNKRGGHDGQPIQVVVESPPSFTPEIFLAAFNSLADEEQVVAFMSPGNCQFVLPGLQSHPDIPSWGATSECGADLPNMFSVGAGATTLPMLRYAIENGSKVFAVAYPSSVPQLKTGFVDPLADYLELNPDIDTELLDVGMPFPASAADWDAAIAKMKEAGVDAAFIASTPEGSVVGLQEAEIQGFAPSDGILWIFGPNLYTPDIAADPVFEGTYALSTNYPWEDTSNKQVKKMIKVTKGKLEVQDGFAIGGYASAALLEASIKPIKGEVTPESVLAQWQKTKKIALPLTPMKVNFTDYKQNPSGGQIMKIENGVFVTASDFLVIPAKDFIV